MDGALLRPYSHELKSIARARSFHGVIYYIGELIHPPSSRWKLPRPQISIWYWWVFTIALNGICSAVSASGPPVLRGKTAPYFPLWQPRSGPAYLYIKLMGVISRIMIISETTAWQGPLEEENWRVERGGRHTMGWYLMENTFKNQENKNQLSKCKLWSAKTATDNWSRQKHPPYKKEEIGN